MKTSSTLLSTLKNHSFTLDLRWLIPAVLGLAIIAAVPFASAANVTWTGGNGDLNDAAQWSSNPSLPGAGDHVFFLNTGATYSSTTASFTNEAATFSNASAVYHDVNLGAGHIWELSDGLTVLTATNGSWTVYTGTVAVTNVSGTAVAAFGGGGYGGKPVINGGTLKADYFTYTNAVTGQGLRVNYGELTVYHGSAVSNALTSTSIAIGDVANQTATVNLFGGNNSWTAESLFVGQAGQAAFTVDSAGTDFSFTGISLVVGRSTAVDNTFTVSGGATAEANLTAGIVLGYESASSDNVLAVTGVDSRFDVVGGNVNIGRAGSSNAVIISDGGVMSVNTSGQPTYIGEQATASDNLLRVTGAGSRYETASSGDNSYIGVGMAGSNNKLEVTDGGAVSAYRLYVGLSGGANNTVEVQDGGSLRVLDSMMTLNGSGNTVTASQGGILEFIKKNPAIYAYGGAITLGDGGVVSFANISDAPTAALSGLTYSGNANGLRLNNASNTAVASYTFQTGMPGTYAQLDLVGASTWVGTTLIIGNGGRLAGGGTINATTTVASGGTLAIGHSPGTMTFNNDLTLSSGSTSEFEILGFSNGQFDLAQGGAGTQTVTFGGTLSLAFTNGFNTLGTVKIFDFESYSGAFSTVNTSGLAAGYTASFDALSGEITVVPEPGTAALAALGLGAILWRLSARRRRLA